MGCFLFGFFFFCCCFVGFVFLFLFPLRRIDDFFLFCLFRVFLVGWERSVQG